MQCGYCINGMIMESAAFLARNKKPSEDDIKNALAANLDEEQFLVQHLPGYAAYTDKVRYRLVPLVW